MSKKFRDSGLVPEEAARFCDVDCSKDPVLTSQSSAKDVDINEIVRRMQKGAMPVMRNGEPFYGDVSDLGGLQEAIMKVQEADELFMSMDAEIRNRFDNDPVKMVDFLMDENNRKEAEELGLIQKAPEEPKPAEPAKAQLPS